ncbi:helix-turn-helix transcriptional regulator [Iamia sp.]|uniref:helix-turn-helix transcriptional regulator n=1 Tax=Iamia sp. TaxID=2722710 RepID=UPI002B7EB153|nr:LuxR C-terminal-related transcriptional regulator [Iamia sp.]HXH56612.1 LuxR C-terminal-related transcriptional regulator [Iamia sp.]
MRPQQGSLSPPPSAVLLVDRARGPLDALQLAIEATEGLICAGAGPSLSAMAVAPSDEIDAVIIQAATPGADLVLEVATARARHPCAIVVVVASFVDSHLVETLTDKGATAVVSTSVPLTAVLAIASRGLGDVPDVSDEHVERVATVGRDLGLTIQQLHILRHFADGLTPQQIAQEHGLSLSTVREHLKRLRQRLRCASGVELVVAAHHLGLLPHLDRPLR